MYLRNSVQLIGNLGADPKITLTKNKTKVARFSVATTEFTKKTKDGKGQTTWHNVVAWGKDAETVEKRCTKGTEVVIFGKLVNNSWDDANGVRHYGMEIHVSEIICRPKLVQS